MAKPQKSTAQSEVPGLVKKGPLYYLKRDWQLYALMLLPMVFIIVFKYFAYTGLSVAFLDYKIGKGYAGSKFVGLKIFEKVFKHRDFTKAVVNTLLLNVLDLIFSFPMPIILALLLNEIRVKWFKRTTQTLLYLPHFLSWVVIGAVAYQMFATQSGVVNALIANAGKSPIPLSWDGHLVQTRWRQWAVQAISMPACFCCWLGLQQVSALLCHNTGVLNGMMNCAACWEHF